MDNTNQNNLTTSQLGFRSRGFTTQYVKPRSNGQFDVYRSQPLGRVAPKLPPRQGESRGFSSTASVQVANKIANPAAPHRSKELPSTPKLPPRQSSFVSNSYAATHQPDAQNNHVRSGKIEYRSSDTAPVPQRRELDVLNEVELLVKGAPEASATISSKKEKTKKEKKQVTFNPFKKIIAFKNQPRSAQLMTIMAAIVFVFGMYVSFVGFNKNIQLEAQVNALQPTEEDNDGQVSPSSVNFIPSEDEPNDSTWENYVVPADMPRFLKIPSINSQGIIRKLGVDENGAMMVPKNIYEIGWYEESAKPNDTKHGAVLVAAHVEGPTKAGVFYRLKDVSIGDTIELEDGAGRWYTYKVMDKRTYSKDAVDMRAALTPITEGKQGLNLITCTGTFMPGEHTYDQRLVVFTELVK